MVYGIMRNLTLMTDLYQLTMMQGYFKSGLIERTAVFDLFFRAATQINYAIAAGLEQAIDYIQSLKFTKDDIKYLKSLKLFDDNFVQYLSTFKFTGDIYSVEEGEVVFPNEPILVVKAPMGQAQLLETTLLNIINHQTLIASKAARIVEAAGDSQVVEFGLRRAQGPDAGIYGTRAAMIGGCKATSNVLGAKLFSILPKGTHGHSWVLSFENELASFRAFADSYPDSCMLLVDTYDTLKSGMPNAIKVFKELKAKGHKPLGIRLDSGDLAFLSKRAREMLDKEGFNDAIIFASNDIDEHLIEQLKLQSAKIDVYGVGTRLITSQDMPSLGGVYKLAAFEKEKGNLASVMKFSNSDLKMTNPGEKNLYRIYDGNDNMAFADLICLENEVVDSPLVLTHPYDRWKQTVLEKFTARKLLVPIFKKGKLVYKVPTLSQTIVFSENEKKHFWTEYKRIIRPQVYKVNLSDKLYELRQSKIKTRQ